VVLDGSKPSTDYVSQCWAVHVHHGGLWDGRNALARRRLLTDEERQALLGIPSDADSLARLFTLSRSDRNLVAERRSDTNRLGCAVQLALLRHPGTALAYLDQTSDVLVTWMASQLDIPAATFSEYARRPQTMTDHARQLAATLGLRTPTMADLPLMIEAAADAARGTDHGRASPSPRQLSQPCELPASSCLARPWSNASPSPAGHGPASGRPTPW
jgi:hypothetical protein